MRDIKNLSNLKKILKSLDLYQFPKITFQRISKTSWTVGVSEIDDNEVVSNTIFRDIDDDTIDSYINMTHTYVNDIKIKDISININDLFFTQ